MKNASAELTPTRAADEESGGHALYDEYVRGFDEVPVLRDAVALPPRRSPQPDFRKGERPDKRAEARPDPYSAREVRLAETETLYAEYLDPAAARPKPKRKRKRKRKRKTKSKKAPTRTRSGHHGAGL
jgi:hypothetical protein